MASRARGGGPRFEPPSDGEARAIRRALGAWFEGNARDLPWRRTRDPYAVWISEAMLQQTRVEVVLDYWPRFLAAFPDPASLAAAPEERVLEAWSGLGYYRRARALQSAARVIAAEHGGRFPEDLDAALSLPGVGPYTAGAVLSIALDRAAPIVDGNVERVFSRLFLLDGVRTSGPLLRAAWEAARWLVERERDGIAPRVWNQALMELGALVCAPRAPRCGECPVERWCRGRAAGLEAELPRPRPKRAPVDVALEVHVAERDGRWLVVRRPGDGLMAGMWEFPTVEVSGPGLFPSEHGGALGARLEPQEELFSVTHGITKHRIRALVRRAHAAGRVAGPTARWVAPPDAEALALTGMARKVLARLGTRGAGLGSASTES